MHCRQGKHARSRRRSVRAPGREGAPSRRRGRSRGTMKRYGHEFFLLSLADPNLARKRPVPASRSVARGRDVADGETRARRAARRRSAGASPAAAAAVYPSYLCDFDHFLLAAASRAQALKKDFTRSGRRTLGGLLTDGLSSVQASARPSPPAGRPAADAPFVLFCGAGRTAAIICQLSLHLSHHRCCCF